MYIPIEWVFCTVFVAEDPIQGSKSLRPICGQPQRQWRRRECSLRARKTADSAAEETAEQLIISGLCVSLFSPYSCFCDILLSQCQIYRVYSGAWQRIITFS